MVTGQAGKEWHNELKPSKKQLGRLLQLLTLVPSLGSEGTAVGEALLVLVAWRLREKRKRGEPVVREANEYAMAGLLWRRVGRSNLCKAKALEVFILTDNREEQYCLIKEEQ